MFGTLYADNQRSANVPVIPRFWVSHLPVSTSVNDVSWILEALPSQSYPKTWRLRCCRVRRGSPPDLGTILPPWGALGAIGQYRSPTWHAQGPKRHRHLGFDTGHFLLGSWGFGW